MVLMKFFFFFKIVEIISYWYLLLTFVSLFRKIKISNLPHEDT